MHVIFNGPNMIAQKDWDALVKGAVGDGTEAGSPPSAGAALGKRKDAANADGEHSRSSDVRRGSKRRSI